MKENVKISAKESIGLYKVKQHNPWFDEECLGFLDQRKQAKMQWLQDPNKSSVDNLNAVRRDASRHFRKKTKEYLKAEIDELETISKIENIREFYMGINDQPGTNRIKDEKGDLVADLDSILVGWVGKTFLSAAEGTWS